MSGSESRPPAAGGTAAERVGFAGLGIMGSRMAARLAGAGVALTVWNRTRERAERFAAEHGAQLAATPAELGERSDIVLSMLVDGPQVHELLLGPSGVASSAAPGMLCVDCSTIGARAARELAAALGARGLGFVDAPVTGSAPRAAEGTLTIMCGGAQEAVARAMPVLRHLGELVLGVGGPGQGQMLKLVNNALAAANAAAVGEALLVARAGGLDLEHLQRVVGSGSGASTMLELKGPAMAAHDYTPLFKLEHMLKDVRLCLQEAELSGTPFAAAAHAHEVLTAALGRGLGDQDFAALIEALEGFAGRRL